MTVYDLRDRSAHYGQIAMGMEDRLALSIAADRERARLSRKRWYETWAGKAVAVASLAASAATVWGQFHH